MLFRLQLLVCLMTITYVLSLNIECNCGDQNYHAVGSKYYCAVISDFIIDSQNQVQIETLKNSHISGKSDDDDIYFHISTKSIQYFPRGLEKFYKNLKGIVIWHTQLKEIHQEDLKKYPKLNFLNLSGNKIEIIQDDLFDFNPDLIVFENMKLIHIGATTFDSLTKLSTFYLGGNPCTNESSLKDRTATLKVISSLKSSCISSEFTSLKRKIENLEQISKNLNFANSPIFSQNLINFQEEFTASKFINFSILKQKLQRLMDLKIKSPYENLGGVLSGFMSSANSYSIIEEKLTHLKLKIDQDLEDNQQNMMNTMDLKIQHLENRLTTKMEEILDEKLEKVMISIGKIVTML
ncbi:unnamed protein product [Chironomus riparius]|uniref:Uncharacterized protein n=1 Tax=Chironomus riparius TaxID=315576 RepID=A0A9N9WYX6_9DIPT|nr:unnamed protein product [Chironomus riparius]